jgi:hypothetical protein
MKKEGPPGPSFFMPDPSRLHAQPVAYRTRSDCHPMQIRGFQRHRIICLTAQPSLTRALQQYPRLTILPSCVVMRAFDGLLMLRGKLADDQNLGYVSQVLNKLGYGGVMRFLIPMESISLPHNASTSRWQDGDEIRDIAGSSRYNVQRRDSNKRKRSRQHQTFSDAHTDTQASEGARSSRDRNCSEIADLDVRFPQGRVNGWQHGGRLRPSSFPGPIEEARRITQGKTRLLR